jgi:hypothetical protein
MWINHALILDNYEALMYNHECRTTKTKTIKTTWRIYE